jgi:formamidopyrimidine-DNA glycosylase
MPELPEVETMVRGIAGAAQGSVIDALRLAPCKCRPMDIRPRFSTVAKRVAGHTINRVFRRAKRIVFELNGASRNSSRSGAESSYLVVEPRMTGLMLLADPPDVEHLRVEWCLTRGRRRQSLWYWDRRGLGTLRLYTAAQFDESLGPKKLGPDALEFTADVWSQRLSATSRAIKVALLDQRLAAGIGNLYASEILHCSRIHPQARADRLRPADIRRLHEAVLHILTEAIRYEGSTLGDGTYRNALNKAGGYQNEHRVYAREGTRCPTCRKCDIVRIVQAQRSTFYCPRCQRVS